MILGLALGALGLLVWAGGVVVGQGNPHELPPPVAAKPVLSLDSHEALEKGAPPLAAPAAALPSPSAAPGAPGPLSAGTPLPPATPVPAMATPVPPPAAIAVPPSPSRTTAPAPASPAPVPMTTPAAAPAPFAATGAETDAGPMNDNPTGHQEPAVSLEWVGPPTVKLGQPASFMIVLKNISGSAVNGVVVRNRVPANVSVKDTEPKATTENDTLVWELGTLQPQQEKRLELHLVPQAKGHCTCQAVVSFTGASAVQLQVQEPKLILKASAPEKALLGDTTGVMLTVSNPGDGSADHVKVKATLTEGLENVRGRDLDFDLGNLGPNESRSVQVLCATKAGGEQSCKAVATSEGGLTSEDTAVFPVLQPKLELAVGGPHLRYLDRPGIYTLKVTNPGDAPANNVQITDEVPQGFKFMDASGGGRHDYATRTVTWFLGDLAPHQSKDVTLQVLAVNIGEFKHVAVARAARGLECQAEAATRVEGLSALLIELVDLDDPVEIGANARYELRVTNTGSKTETNVQVVCTLPDKMEFWGAQGAGNCKYRVEGKDVIFESLPRLAPRADAIFRVNARPVAAGDVRFKARVKADSLSEPVNKEESTKVFGDDVPSTAPAAPPTAIGAH